MWIENLVSLGVRFTTKCVPKRSHRLGNNIKLVTGIRTNEKSSIVHENFIFERWDDVIHQIPIVIGVTDHAERCVGIDFSEHPPDEGNFVTINSIVGSHNTVFSAYCTHSNLGVRDICIVILVNVGESGNSACFVEAS